MVQRAFSKFTGCRALGALLVLLITPMGASGHAWSWTTEPIDTAGMVTSLAADAQGNLHISYRVNEGWILKYGFRPAGSSRWFTMVLDQQLGGFFAYLRLDSQGNPHICYTPGRMKYAHWDGRKWHSQEIGVGSGAVGFTCSVTVAPDGTPHLSWYQLYQNGVYFYHLKYAVLRDGAWLTQTIDFNGEAGKYNSIHLDSQGFPHISYSAFPGGELRYARWNGRNWVRQILDSPDYKPAGGTRSMGNSLILDAQGRGQISYYDNESLKYAREQGNKWSIEIVDSLVDRNFWQVGWEGYRSSQALDRRGLPHVCYESAQGLKHAYWDGKQWHAQLIAAGPRAFYYYSSMAIGPDDTVYISFRDPVDGSLRLAIGRPSAAQETEKAENKTGKD